LGGNPKPLDRTQKNVIVGVKERTTMHTIYFGTNNAAKVNYMKDVLKKLSLNIIGMNEVQNIDHDINEKGKEPLENARIKAWHYYRQINRPVFSIDSGLFFENIDYNDQPGTYIRRINGVKLNDDEMVEYYSKLTKKYGGEITGYYKNALCIIINKEMLIEKDDGKINTERFILTSTPHPKRVEGWPLDSLSKEMKSGKYYYDIHKIWDNACVEKEYENIFNEAIEKMEAAK
jgi:8-oxo-dGTP diphosphatase